METEDKLSISTEDYLDLVNVLEMFGDLLIKIGDFEKKVGTFNKFQNIIEERMEDIITGLEENVELSLKIGAIMVKFLTLTIRSILFRPAIKLPILW